MEKDSLILPNEEHESRKKGKHEVKDIFLLFFSFARFNEAVPISINIFIYINGMGTQDLTELHFSKREGMPSKKLQ